MPPSGQDASSSSTGMAAAPAPPGRQQLAQFLAAYRVDKGHEHTHTSMARPSGSFYLPVSAQSMFMQLYTAAMLRGEDLHITERHRHIGPVVIDLDFRYEPAPHELASAALLNLGVTTASSSSSSSSSTAALTAPSAVMLRRRHGLACVEAIVAVYADALARMVETPDEFDLYVAEKPSGPTLYKGLVKDGLHVVVPSVVTRSAVQLLVRRDVLPALSEVFARHHVDLANRIEDVVDEAVIERNNWMMHGSKKPGGEAYAVTAVYRYSCTTGATVLLERGQYVEPTPELLSIRNKDDENEVREEHRERVDAFVAKTEEERKRREAVQAVLASSASASGGDVRNNTCEDIELVRKLVGIMDSARVDNYNDWVRLGWCLRNIDHRLLEAWVEISKRSSKYVEGECPRLWNAMRVGGLGIGTLHMWARSDSPDRYRELLRTDLVGLIKASVTGSHYDVARVVHHLYRYDYVCCNIRNRTWYEFKEHRWRECDSAYSLRRRLSTDVFKEYVAVKTQIGQRAMVTDDEAEQKDLMQQSKKLAEIALKLKVTSFKDNVLKECAELFYQERFEDRLNSNTTLLGFENGVYDLEQHEFREGRPDDYVSFSTGINYVPLVEDHPVVRDICRFWETVQPDPAIREYVLLTLASCLSGTIREERFHIWTGSGCHAPGTPLLRASGELVFVEDVRVGDLLAGDDGSSRTVLRLIRGEGQMLRVIPESGSDAGPFVVNDDHVLSLKVHRPSRLRATPDDRFEVSWLLTAPDLLAGAADGPLYARRSRMYDSHDLASAAYRDLVWDGVSPDAQGDREHTGPSCLLLNEGHVLDVTVRRYLAHLDEHRRLLQGPAEEPDRAARNKDDNDPHLFLYRPAVDGSSIQGPGCLVGFRIEPNGVGSYCGFELDGNHRYLMADGLVTHNSNGKSLSVSLFEKTLGQYCCKFPVTLLTQKRAASNVATPEIARAKGRRFAVLQEPSEDERLHVGQLKELSGGDTVQTRELFKAPCEWRPQFKLFLLCNTLPHVPSDDGGTWRRIRVVEFGSKFVEHPHPDRPNEFPIDMELCGKLEGWREHFMALLLQYYRRYVSRQLDEPPQVVNSTREYQRTNDHMADFVDTCIERAPEPSALLSLDDAFAELKEWMRQDHIPMKVPKKSAVQKYLDRSIVRSTSVKGRPVYRGFRLRDRMGVCDDFED